MNVKDVEVYEGWKADNTDSHGIAIFKFAEEWATIMEMYIDLGYKVANVAEKAAQDADTEGLTGFMYSASISVLYQCWEHGDELRAWHSNEGGEASYA